MSRLGPTLIVGGGIAGLTLATALHRRGLDAVVIERNTHWDPVGGGIAVQPNAMRVLQPLGIGSEYDRVVGADGIHSTVRQFAFGTATPIYGDQMVWRSVAPICPPESDAVQFWLGDGIFFGLCPVGGGRTYGFGNVTEPRIHDLVEGRLKRLRDRFAAYGELIQNYLAALEHDEQIHCGPIEWLEVELW